jgi:hypothetical protein
VVLLGACRLSVLIGACRVVGADRQLLVLASSCACGALTAAGAWRRTAAPSSPRGAYSHFATRALHRSERQGASKGQDGWIYQKCAAALRLRKACPTGPSMAELPLAAGGGRMGVRLYASTLRVRATQQSHVAAAARRPFAVPHRCFAAARGVSWGSGKPVRAVSPPLAAARRRRSLPLLL